MEIYPPQQRSLNPETQTETTSLEIDLLSLKSQTVDHETQTTGTAPDKRVDILERKVKSLYQELHQKDLKILALNHVKNKIRKRSHSNESLDTALKRYFKGRYFVILV